jgi:hypothetical protein
VQYSGFLIFLGKDVSETVHHEHQWAQMCSSDTAANRNWGVHIPLNMRSSITTTLQQVWFYAFLYLGQGLALH